MRDDTWYTDVEQSIMILHAKIDQLVALMAEQHDLLNVLIDLEQEEEELLNDDPSAS